MSFVDDNFKRVTVRVNIASPRETEQEFLLPDQIQEFLVFLVSEIKELRPRTAVGYCFIGDEIGISIPPIEDRPKVQVLQLPKERHAMLCSDIDPAQMCGDCRDGYAKAVWHKAECNFRNTGNCFCQPDGQVVAGELMGRSE